MQSNANQSQFRDSLLSGKITGKFSKIGSDSTFRARIRQKNQRYRDGFPVSKNRESGKSNRELFVAHQGKKKSRGDVYETANLGAFSREDVPPLRSQSLLCVISNRMPAARASIFTRALRADYLKTSIRPTAPRNKTQKNSAPT
jgi:hypothetical protein